MLKAEGESARALDGAGLGASPSVAARQLPLGGPARKSHCSDLPCRWRCREVKVGSFRYLVRARPEPPSACGISPRSAGGEGKWRLRAGLLGGSDLGGGVRAALVVAGLGVSPSVAARQLPLGRPARKSHCSDLPCRWRCREVKVGSFRYLVRARPEPPSACGISPRGAGGEGKWRLRAGLLGGGRLDPSFVARRRRHDVRVGDVDSARSGGWL